MVYNKIFETLALRKSYHLVGGLFMLVALAQLGSNFMALGVFYLIAFWVLGKRISFAMLGILFVLSLTHSTFVTIGAVIVFWIGDEVAALVGARFGRKRWSWKPDKSLIGSLAFFSGAAAALLLFFLIVFHSLSVAACLLVLVTALVGTLAEISPLVLIADRKPDDNLAILVSSGLVLLMGAHILSIAIPPG